MRALLDRDDTLAQEVIDRDRQVNAYDVEVDERCVELLALHQPAAGDLRFITTAMKIVTDLERIGDQAVTCRAWPSRPSAWSRRAWTPSWRATHTWRGGCERWTDSGIRSFGSC